jgi:hypothetical protein
MPDSLAAEDRSQSRRSSVTSAIAKQTDQPRRAAGMLFPVSLGLIGAAIVIIFAIASFPPLYTGNEMQTRSSAEDQSEINSIHTDLSPPTEDKAPPVELGSTSPSVVVSRPLSSTPIEGPLPADVPTPEMGRSPPTAQPVLRAKETSQPELEAERRVAPQTPPTSAGAPGEPSIQFPIQQREPVKPDPGSAPSNTKIPAASAPGNQSYDYRLRTDTAFRKSRIIKECGPISDPALHRHCVATFNVYSRAR